MKRVCFFGDSLIQRTDQDYQIIRDITAELQAQHPEFNYVVLESGVSGNRIAAMRQRMRSDCLDLHPDSAIIYWDSDVDRAIVNTTEYSAQYLNAVARSVYCGDARAGGGSRPHVAWRTSARHERASRTLRQPNRTRK